MDTAQATLAPNALVPAAPGRPYNGMPSAHAAGGFGTLLGNMPPRKRMSLAVGLAALVAIVMALALWGREGDYRVLYANLSDKDGGAIITQLSQMNVPYRHADGGSAILVPADRVHDLRLRLASQGLPKGSVAGFELMDSSRFGMTQFQERLTFQRGLEGELTRSIQALAAVADARVHLALPNQNGFFREQQKPSASVLLTLHPGRSLDRAQVAGIVHLVSSSVPELATQAVSVVDDSGALLSSQKDANDPLIGLDARQRQYVTQLEATYTQRVMDILEPIVGRNNVRAQVSADVDFSLVESTSELYKPNQGDQPATVRSQQVLESTGGQAAPGGVPGAVANQPPAPVIVPINGLPQGMQAAQANGAGNGTQRRESVVNYEVDKTIRVMRNGTGNVQRLSAAVVVNHRSTTANNGRTTTVALTPDEMEKLETLVRETIGFSEERGDSVRVINAPFQQPERVEITAIPLWQQPEMLSLMRSLATPAALALMALVVVFGVIRPALKSAQANRPSGPGSTLDAMVSGAELLPAPGGTNNVAVAALPGPPPRLDDLRQLARENPAAVANIVRSWVTKEAEAKA